MLAVKCPGDGFVEGTGLEIAGEHGRPGHSLQQRPVCAECGNKRKNDKDFAESQKHDFQPSEKIHKVKGF